MPVTRRLVIGHNLLQTLITLAYGLRSQEVKEKRFILTVLSLVSAMTAFSIKPQAMIEAIIYEILASGIITIHERQQLKSVILDYSLNEADHTLIDRLLYGVRHGLLKKVD